MQSLHNQKILQFQRFWICCTEAKRILAKLVHMKWHVMPCISQAQGLKPLI